MQTTSEKTEEQKQDILELAVSKFQELNIAKKEEGRNCTIRLVWQGLKYKELGGMIGAM